MNSAKIMIMKYRFYVIALLLLPSSVCLAQVIPAYDLGGASKPKPDWKFRDEDQYKRVHQSALRWILRGKMDEPESFLNQYLAEHPRDAETLYMLGILHGQRGDIDIAEQFMKQAIAAGLPEDRLVAGPREILKPLLGTETLKAAFRRYRTDSVHGPLIGATTDTTASFWIRTAHESNVRIVTSIASDLADVKVSEVVRSTAANDYTTVVTVTDLQPNTKYFYGIKIDEAPFIHRNEMEFRTLPTSDQPAKFVIAFGGGAGYVPENERMWTTVESFAPQALLLLGDNVYIDDPESVTMQQYTYQRRQSRPEWRSLTGRTPVFTIWDDHDFSTNDSWGGPDIDIPFWKNDWVLPIFRQNWANPGYGGGAAQPGCYYNFKIADVDFIMLDCRYYRTDPKQSPRTMLGPVQLTWLKQQLTAATGTFKVIASSVPWDFRTKGDSFDTWNGYQEEHEEILSFIEQQRIEGVVLMSADRHRSDAWKINRPNGYDLYEFNSSRLTNQHIHPTMEKAGAIFSYNDPQSFGLITFDTIIDDPQVTYEIVNINAEKPHSITVKRSELGF